MWLLPRGNEGGEPSDGSTCCAEGQRCRTPSCFPASIPSVAVAPRPLPDVFPATHCPRYLTMAAATVAVSIGVPTPKPKTARAWALWVPVLRGPWNLGAFHGLKICNRRERKRRGKEKEALQRTQRREKSSKHKLLVKSKQMKHWLRQKKEKGGRSLWHIAQQLKPQRDAQNKGNNSLKYNFHFEFSLLSPFITMLHRIRCFLPHNEFFGLCHGHVQHLACLRPRKGRVAKCGSST